MVAAKEHDCIVEYLFLAQRADDCTNLVIDMRAERIVGTSHFGERLLRKSGPIVTYCLQRNRCALFISGPERAVRLVHVELTVIVHIAL